MDDRARRGAWMARLLVGLLCLVASLSTASLRALAASGEQPSALDASAWIPPEEATLQAEVLRLRDSPLAIAPLLDLMAVRSWMSTDQALASIAQSQRVLRDPLAVAWQHYELLRTYLALGRADDARRLEKQLGFVDGWQLAGPFRNDGHVGFFSAYAPEADGFQGPEQTFEGKFDGMTWIPAHRLSESGYLAANEHVAEAFSATIYAVTECYFEGRDVEAQLAVDGAYKLWVNETPIAQSEVHRGGVFLRDFAKLKAHRGWNRIFLKVATERVEPGWHLRFVDHQGRSVVRECRPLESATAPVLQSDDFPEPTTIAERLQSSASRWSDAEKVNAAYVVKTLHPADAAEPWTDFIDAISMSELGATHLLRAAKVQSQHWRAMEYVAEASQRDASVGEALQMLQMRSAEVGFHATLDYVRGVQALANAAPDDPRPALAWLRYAGSELRPVGVVPAMEQLLDRYGARPGLCAVLLDQLANDYPAAIRVIPRCADRSLHSLAAFKAYLTSLATTGQLAAVHAAVNEGQALWGHRRDWQRILQMVAGFEADWPAVLASVDEEIAMRPNDAESYVRRADALIRLSRNDEAALALNKAVELRPQLREAREQLAFLEAQEEKFFSAWRVGLDELRSLRDELDLSQHDLGRVVDQRVVNVFPSGLATVYVQRAFAAVSRAGADMVRSFQIGFSPDSEVVEIVAVRILRPDGSVRETFDTRDVKPYSGPSSIYYDVRTRIISLPGLEAGDLVSLEYTISDVAYQNLFDDYFGDIWFLDSYYPTALARYVLYTPNGREIFAELSGETAQMEERDEGDKHVRVLEARGLKAIERERGAPGASQVFRYLHLSTYDDANHMANWYWNLVHEQLTTSPQMIATVQRLIAGVSNRREQVARIYEYVVRNTRYVGLEFGIHGFKPYRTTECFDRKFGDCKDTASLIKVMLGIAGIESHLVLIRTRDLGRLDNKYPSLSVFNHAIAYVPEFELYLDGTAGFSGSQELPGMDQGATALHILDGKGGTPVVTPYLSAELDVSEWSAVVDARTEKVTAEMRARYIGGAAPSMRQNFEAADQQRETIERWAARLVPNIEVTRVRFNDLAKIEEPVEFIAQTTGGRWLQARGDEHVLLPFGRSAFMLSEYAGASTRVLPLDLGEPSIEQVRFEIQLPETFAAQNMEAGDTVVEESGIGRFVMRTHWDAAAKRLRVEGTLRWEASEVAPADYERFRTWARRVERLANEPFIFRVAQ